MTAEQTGDGVTDADILEAARALGVLNTGADSAPRILAALCDPANGPAQVSTTIAQEPGLAARVLRVANSAFYGFSGHIGTIDRAVVVLGLDAVRGVAAAACLDRSILRANEASPLDMEAMLRHSVATAAAAEALARLRHRALAPEAFIAGLLHDFGVTLQLRLDPAGLRAVIESLRAAPGGDVRALEAGRARVGHERCAAVIFAAWNLPAALAEAARHHHDPARAAEPHRALAALVNVGNHLGLAAGFGFPLEPAAGPLDPGAMALLGATGDDLVPIAAALPGRVGELRRALAGG